MKQTPSPKRWAIQVFAAVLLVAGGFGVLKGMKWLGHKRAEQFLEQYSTISNDTAAPIFVLNSAGPVEFSGPNIQGWQTVALRSPLTSAHTVRTGDWGRVDLALDRKVVVRVGPNSTLQFASMIRDLSNRIKLVEIAMDTGQVISVVGTLNDGARFSIKTPTATVGVRGTVFMVESTPEGTSVSTLEGTVEVSTPDDPGNILNVVAGERLEMSSTPTVRPGAREILGRYVDIPPETRRQMSQATRENAFTRPQPRRTKDGRVIPAVEKRTGPGRTDAFRGKSESTREAFRRGEKKKLSEQDRRTARGKTAEKSSFRRLSDLRQERKTAEIHRPGPSKATPTKEAKAPPSATEKAQDKSTESTPPAPKGETKEPVEPKEDETEEPVEDETATEQAYAETASDALAAQATIQAILDECRDALEQLAATPCLAKWTKPGFTLNVNGKPVLNTHQAAATLSKVISAPSVSIHDLAVTVRDTTALAVFTLDISARRNENGVDVSRQFLVIMEFVPSGRDWLAQSASAM